MFSEVWPHTCPALLPLFLSAVGREFFGRVQSLCGAPSYRSCSVPLKTRFFGFICDTLRFFSDNRPIKVGSTNN